MPSFRTSVRYEGSRCGFVFVLCISSDGGIVRLFCVVYSSTVEKAERSYRTSLGRLIYRRRFILLVAHSSLHPRCPLLLSPLVFFPHMCVPVRLACRLVMSSRCASCFMRPVASCRSSCRHVVPSARRPSSRLSSRMGAVSSCCSLVLVAFVMTILPCVRRAVSFRFGIPFAPSCRSSRLSSRPTSRFVHLVSSCHLVLVVRGGCSCPFSCPFPCSHRFALLVARSCSPIRSRFMSPLWGGAVRHGHVAGTACSYRLIRPIIALTRYSLTRCGMAAGG